MKNRKSLYILIPAVLVVWSLIVYRIYNAQQDDSAVYSKGKPAEISSSGPLEKLNYDLLLNYADPFLKGIKWKKKKEVFKEGEQLTIVQPNESSKTLPDANQAENDIWKEVRYLGLIEHKLNHSKIVLLEIKGNNYILKLGEIKEGFLLKRIAQDSILLKNGIKEAYIKK
jgi:hypothetical protein